MGLTIHYNSLNQRTVMPAHSYPISSSSASGDHTELKSKRLNMSVANLRQQLAGTNINEQTFLATDYLNHFNEIEMLVEMLPSMPECIEDICLWQPKSYEDHFTDSGFRDRDLAVLAYRSAPEIVKKRFDETIAQLDRCVIDAIESLKETYEMEAPEQLGALCAKSTVELRDYINRASAIINGQNETVCSVDFSSSGSAERDSIEKTQAAVEALFND